MTVAYPFSLSEAENVKKKILIGTAGLILIIVFCGGMFWYYHPTHYQFNDRFIIGSTKQEIIEKYGEPYSSGESSMTYRIRDNTPEWVMSYDDSLWYEIYFNDGIAEYVKLREGYLGG